MSGRVAKLLRRVLASRLGGGARNPDWLALKRQWNRLTKRERASWRRTPGARRKA